MVDFSLKNKGVANWAKGRGSFPRKATSPDSTMAFKSSRYQDIKPSNSELPKVGAKDRTKAGTMMKRRLSVHQNNHGPMTFDYENMPSLPTNNAMNETSFSFDNVDHQKEVSLSHSSSEEIPPRDVSLKQLMATNTTNHQMKAEPYSSKSLRHILSDSNFKAKEFVTERLGEATAVDIDQFTSALNDLSFEVQDEIKTNINTSYKEILLMNKELLTANNEMKSLRVNVTELQEIMKQLAMVADKRLQTTGNYNEIDDLKRSSSSVSVKANIPTLLPPAKASGGVAKDRTSVIILEKMWNDELLKLFKTVDGAQKFIAPTPGRHILFQSSNWVEINPATLKQLQRVHIFILNDVLLIAAKHDNKQMNLEVSKFCALRDVSLNVQPDSVIAFDFAGKQHVIYKSRSKEECAKVVDIIRKAKDELREISQAEEDNNRKIRDSFTLLYSDKTPNREGTASPSKTHSRQISMGASSNTPGRHRSELQNDALLNSISRSMHVRSRSQDGNGISRNLKNLDDELEDLDLEIERFHFDKAIRTLKYVEGSLKSYFQSANVDEQMMIEVITLKCSQRRNTLYSKITNLLGSESTSTNKLRSYMLNLIELNEPVEAFEVFLQNRSNFINQLILEIGVIDNVTSFITQIAIIRFQMIKKVILLYLEVAGNLERDYTSILVCWCSNEVDKHFELMNRELLNSVKLSIQAIKITRKQIDEIKTVGMDYVYKLDDFMKRNSEVIY